MKLYILCLLFFSLESTFKEITPPFLLQTKQIHIPNYPDAFNPSIIRWKDKLLMSFRNIANPKNSYHSSQIGLVLLDDNFDPISTPQILKLYDEHFPAYQRAEDGRLIEISGHLLMIYSDNEDPVISKGGFRVYVAEIKEENNLFSIVRKDKLTQYQGEDSTLREKNWTPFNYMGSLLLSYSLNPHLVFKPLIGFSSCETVSFSSLPLSSWLWGELRGGTQSLKLDNHYLTFFHTCLKTTSDYSDGKEMLHYLMGACTFEETPPFALTKISPEPIIGEGFFTGPIYKPYWGSWRGIFPGGFIFDDRYIHIVYGRQNHEIWVVTLDKQGLLDSLIPLDS